VQAEQGKEMTTMRGRSLHHPLPHPWTLWGPPGRLEATMLPQLLMQRTVTMRTNLPRHRLLLPPPPRSPPCPSPIPIPSATTLEDEDEAKKGGSREIRTC
jgi:hypothetical protein